ncbi:endonuclease/exonuclease/phosphatase family protein [Roseateles violae]|uniref:Endonuclease/exonuclease/phosphatase family protein n=1 Tax=Roseateles violae TaxID=3058042 RepID=A0ABT8DRX8_9BURK|nr:endonuclease/exonuclease/phosphatase family protein [Pelomonas sp. PFR6]MDN3920733.1 endonuclease/exonuclease/phosphatase family protein [Pelomonas sp. PFR6]
MSKDNPLKLLPRAMLAAFPLLLAGAAAQAQLIGALQGSSHLSPYNNTDVAGILGIVTARDNNGFWIQDAGDGNALTSDAIYIFRSSASKPLVGSAVSVSGRLVEFRPGGDPLNLTLTEINASSGIAGAAVTVLSTGNALPAARVIGPGFLPPSAIAPKIGNMETAPGYLLQPNLYSMDFYESLEGMRVALPSAIASGQTASGDTFVVSSQQVPAGSRVPAVLSAGNFNGQRIMIDNRITAAPTVSAGARIDNITGVIDYSFANYRLLLTEGATLVSNNLPKETAAIAPGRFGIASYNVENLPGNASTTRFTQIAGQIAGSLGAPQIISLQEIQDNNGTTNNGTVAADVTLNNLAGALNAATGKSYKWVSVDPVNNADGGAGGGNIRQAFMYDSARVSFAGMVGGALQDVMATAGANGQIVLNLGAGRVDPNNPAWTNSRKPLVTEFSVDGQQIIVIANHFNSKGGDAPLFGVGQPPDEVTATQRLQQAQVLGSFVQGLLAINPHANIVLTGDFNDFQFAASLQPLYDAGLTNMTNTLDAGDRYSYVFEGNAQALDHIWVSPNLLAKGDLAYDVVHVNAGYLDQVSDHDPVLLTLGAIPVPTAVPEPATLALMLAGLGAVGLRARRQRRA